MASFLLGGIIGFLAAILLLYWQQIQTLYQNRGTISGVSDILSGIQKL